MPAHRPVDAELLRRARLPAGDADRLTLAGARRIGDPARRREALSAVRRAQYLTRRAARPTVSARTAASHAPIGTAGPRATFGARPEAGGEPRLLIAVEVSRADLRRAGRYDSLVAGLAAGRMSGRAFERRVGAWRPVVVTGPGELAGRYVFVSDPRAALRLAAVAADEGITQWVDSGRARPRPRRIASRRRP